MAGRKGKHAKSKKNTGRFTAGDYGLPESHISSINWDELGSNDDDEITSTQSAREPSPPKRYTRSRSEGRRAVRFNKPITRSQSEREQSPWIEGMPAPFQPSTTHTGESSLEPVNLESIHRGQQRLHAEQARLATELERISADLRDSKKKHNSLEKMVKKLLLKMGCSSSMDTDSD